MKTKLEIAGINSPDINGLMITNPNVLLSNNTLGKIVEYQGESNKFALLSKSDIYLEDNLYVMDVFTLNTTHGNNCKYLLKDGIKLYLNPKVNGYVNQYNQVEVDPGYIELFVDVMPKMIVIENEKSIMMKKRRKKLTILNGTDNR
jgi:hypothetical protein